MCVRQLFETGDPFELLLADHRVELLNLGVVVGTAVFMAVSPNMVLEMPLRNLQVFGLFAIRFSVLFYPSARWFFTNGMGDNGIFFVANDDTGGYERSVGGRAHFFGLGMAMGEPGWPRGCLRVRP